MIKQQIRTARDPGRRAWRLPLLLPLVLAAACETGRPAGAINDEVFIATMVELRRAAMTTAPDPASFAAARDQVLGDQAVTEEQLRAYIESYVRDLAHLAAVWESVNERLSSQDLR